MVQGSLKKKPAGNSGNLVKRYVLFTYLSTCLYVYSWELGERGGNQWIIFTYGTKSEEVFCQAIS